MAYTREITKVCRAVAATLAKSLAGQSFQQFQAPSQAIAYGVGQRSDRFPKRGNRRMGD